MAEEKVIRRGGKKREEDDCTHHPWGKKCRPAFDGSGGVVYLRWEIVLGIIGLLSAAMWYAAEVRLELRGQGVLLDKTTQEIFTQSDWDKERALLIAELTAVEVEVQVLCQEVSHFAKMSGRPISLTCPITFRSRTSSRMDPS